MPIAKIAIIGAGTMGANIALNFASHGQAVHLHDSKETQLEHALQTARTNAGLLQQHGLLAEPIDRLIPRIICLPQLEDAVRDADLVIEAVPEKITLKRWIFTHLDRLCGPETILASNSSTFVPSSMAGSLVHPERKKRFLVIHYWNPAHLVPLVEIVPHPETLASVVDAVKSLLVHCGKTPVVVRKEVPGFIGNRLAFALQREAMHLVAAGVASQEDIDAVAKKGFGRRIPVTGIFGTADLGGLDVYLEVCRSIFPHLSSECDAPAILQRLVEEGSLGVKSGAGWNRYTPEQAAALRDALTKELVHQLQRDREDGAGRGPV